MLAKGTLSKNQLQAISAAAKVIVTGTFRNFCPENKVFKDACGGRQCQILPEHVMRTFLMKVCAVLQRDDYKEIQFVTPTESNSVFYVVIGQMFD